MHKVGDYLADYWNTLNLLESELNTAKQRKTIQALEANLRKIAGQPMEAEDKSLLILLCARLAFYREDYALAQKLVGQVLGTGHCRPYDRQLADDIKRAETDNWEGKKRYNKVWMLQAFEQLTEAMPEGANRQGSEFLPEDSLYDKWQGTDADLISVAEAMMEWLGITPVAECQIGYAKLDTHGSFTSDNGAEVIMVNQEYKRNAFRSVAVLAHEMTHLYLNRKHIGLIRREDNEALIDVATVAVGFGVLVMNGMHMRSRLWSVEMAIGYFRAREYGQFYKQYLHAAYGKSRPVLSYLHPHSLKLISKASNIFSPNRIIRKLALRRAAVRGLVLAAGVFALAGSFWMYGVPGLPGFGDTASTAPQPASVLGAQADPGRESYQACVAEYEAIKTSLASLGTQLSTYDRAANEAGHQALVARQEATNNQLKAKYDACEALRQKINQRVQQQSQAAN